MRPKYVAPSFDAFYRDKLGREIQAVFMRRGLVVRAAKEHNHSSIWTYALPKHVAPSFDAFYREKLGREIHSVFMARSQVVRATKEDKYRLVNGHSCGHST